MEKQMEYTAKDYKSDQYVRWCPGCGDHAVVNTLQKAMAEVGVAPHEISYHDGVHRGVQLLGHIANKKGH